MATPSATHRPASQLIYNLAGITVLVLLCAVGAAYLLDEMGRGSADPAPGAQRIVTQTISGQELDIPAGWFRYGQQVRDGFTSQIDLRFELPDHAGESWPVDVTLLPRSRARTSASLLDRVYLHQFGHGTVTGVPGLVGKPLLGSRANEGETVWYDALSPNPFVAKCNEPIEGRQPQCVRTVHLPSGIAAVYTFDAALLTSWREFDSGMQEWLTRIGAW